LAMVVSSACMMVAVMAQIVTMFRRRPGTATGAAAIVPLAPVEKRATDQLTPDHATPRVVVVKTLLATAPAPNAAIAASVPLAAPVAFPVAEAADDGRDWLATLLGVLLIALGFVSVLGSSPPLREAVLLRD